MRAKSDFQPYLYTFFISCLYDIGKRLGIKQFAIVMLTVLQIVVISAVITRVIYRINNREHGLPVIVCLAFYYLFLPLQMITLAVM